jgi:acetyl esterase
MVTRKGVGAGPGLIETYPATEGMPLHPAIASALEAEAGAPPLETLPDDRLRAVREELALKRSRLHEPLSRVEDRTIAGGAGPIPIRLYTPLGPGPLPIVVFAHGGGWVIGTLDTVDDLCRSISRRSSSLVVSVGYRRAPEHRYPAALHDVMDALRWSAEHAGELNGDANRLVVAGDSAGGNLAAAACLLARDGGGPRIAAQVLIYPVTNHGFDTASYHQHAGGWGLTRDLMIWFWDQYLAKPADGAESLASPLRAHDLKRLPAAFVLTAGYDVLRDDGEAYAARLARSGVPVRCTRYLRMNHGFITLGAVLADARRALDDMAEFLRTLFGS